MFDGPRRTSSTAATCPSTPATSPPTAPACARRSGQILDAGAVPILLGGDDSLPIPMLEAYAGRGRFTILQIDAHIDWRDEVQGERLGLSSGMRRASEMAHIERIIQVGQRGIGSARPSDLADARDWGVTFFPARGVAQAGITLGASR